MMREPMPTPHFAADLVERQTAEILIAWGMPTADAGIAAARLIEADLRGIDSHGIGMMTLYEDLRASGHLNMAAAARIVRDDPVTALIDGDGGLGHVPATQAADLAIEKCRTFGLALTSVRDSNHYGAAGVYALRMARAGFIGLSGSNVHKAAVVPTFGAEAMFGTNPLAFAAPMRGQAPFVLDMATSTAAIGKIKLALLHGQPIPEGWALDRDGAPLSDPEQALAVRLLTPLGGSRDLGSHKGYGLAAMIEILSAVLPGALTAPSRGRNRPGANGQGRFDVGHFFIAIDPARFREAGAFEDDLGAMVAALRESRPQAPGQPVLVAGDPEWAAEAARRQDGIPIPKPYLDALRDVAARAGAPFLLTE